MLKSSARKGCSSTGTTIAHPVRNWKAPCKSPANARPSDDRASCKRHAEAFDEDCPVTFSWSHLGIPHARAESPANRDLARPESCRMHEPWAFGAIAMGEKDHPAIGGSCLIRRRKCLFPQLTGGFAARVRLRASSPTVRFLTSAHMWNEDR